MLSDVYFPRINGVSTSIQTFRRELAKLGCRTLLVAPRYPQAFDDDGDVTRVDAWTVPFDAEDRLMRPRRLKASCRALARQFDLIHIQTPFLAHRTGVKLARELGVKVIETYHTYFEEYFHHYMPFVPRRAFRPIARAVSKAQCNAVDAVVSPSAPMADVLREYGVTAPLKIIGTGLELDIFRSGDGSRFRSTHRIPPERPLVLHVGRVAFEKNIEFLIDVFVEVRRQVPDALFIVAGDGPALGSLRRRAEKQGLDDSVMFIGYLEREKSLLDCYKSADVFTFASRTETQGLVLPRRWLPERRWCRPRSWALRIYSSTASLARSSRRRRGSRSPMRLSECCATRPCENDSARPGSASWQRTGPAAQWRKSCSSYIAPFGNGLDPRPRAPRLSRGRSPRGVAAGSSCRARPSAD